MVGKFLRTRLGREVLRVIFIFLVFAYWGRFLFLLGPTLTVVKGGTLASTHCFPTLISLEPTARGLADHLAIIYAQGGSATTGVVGEYCIHADLPIPSSLSIKDAQSCSSVDEGLWHDIMMYSPSLTRSSQKDDLLLHLRTCRRMAMVIVQPLPH